MGKRCLVAVLATVLTFGMAQSAFGESTPREQSGKAEAWSEILTLAKGKQLEAAYRLALDHENDGDPRIWAYLGDCLSYGRGVEADHKRAFEYYRKASERIPYAKYRMGLFFATGTAAPCDKDKAVELMDEAIAAGYRPSDRLIRQTHILLETKTSEYTDPQLKLRFPSRSEKFGLTGVQRFLNRRRSGYGLSYGGAGEWLNIYIYDQGLDNVPDGFSTVSESELRNAERAVSAFAEKGVYKNIRDRIAIQRGVLPLSKLEYSWFSFVYDNKPHHAEGLRSVILIFGARGKFFKIRYSGAVEKDVPPDRLPTMVADILTHLDAALTGK